MGDRVGGYSLESQKGIAGRYVQTAADRAGTDLAGVDRARPDRPTRGC